MHGFVKIFDGRGTAWLVEIVTASWKRPVTSKDSLFDFCMAFPTESLLHLFPVVSSSSSSSSSSSRTPPRFRPACHPLLLCGCFTLFQFLASKMEAALWPREALWPLPGFLLLVLLPACLSLPEPTAVLSRIASQESIKINITVLQNNGNPQEGQVVLNITYVKGQVYVNDFPLKSGVTRIKCQTLILESGNVDSLLNQKRLGIVSVRIMIHEWPLASSSNLQLIVIQEEVTDIDGKQVQQDEVTEIDILVKDLRVLRHSNYTVPLKESMLYSIPRDNDVLFTLPNIARKDVESPLQTTSHYLLRQVETTIDEEALPGKLPETPVRTDPTSSYKVMCQWVEDIRKYLCKFWLRSFPVFFNLMEVIVVGVIGAALIIKVLKVVCPCEPKGILHLDFIPVVTTSLLPEMPEKKDNIEEKYI